MPMSALCSDEAMALVCSVPASSRGERSLNVHAAISRAQSFHESASGVWFQFENADDIARSLLELVLAERNCCAQFSYSLTFGARHEAILLRVDAPEDLVEALKALYRGLAEQK
jgi:hypothetical protein